MQVLGIVGALDPHTHKVNQANIQGEGKLEAEGVRPQRQADPIGGLGGGTANTLGDCLPCTATTEFPACQNCGLIFCRAAQKGQAVMADADEFVNSNSVGL